MGVGARAWGPRCFQTIGSQPASLVTLGLQVNCLACAWDFCIVPQVFLKRASLCRKAEMLGREEWRWQHWKVAQLLGDLRRCKEQRGRHGGLGLSSECLELFLLKPPSWGDAWSVLS